MAVMKIIYMVMIIIPCSSDFTIDVSGMSLHTSTSIRNLMQSQDLRRAQLQLEREVLGDPANTRAKYLLAFLHANTKDGDLVEAVRLALDIVTCQHEVKSELRVKAAILALDAAVHSTDDKLIRLSTGAICDHHYQHRQFSDALMREAVRLSAEAMIAAGEMEEAGTLLLSDIVGESSLELDLLQLFLLRLAQRQQRDQNTAATEHLLESLKHGTNNLERLPAMDEARMMVRRIITKWKDLGGEYRVEEEVMAGVMVELGLYPSRDQRPAWVEPGLTSRPVWDLASLGPELETSLRMVEAQWEQLRREAEAVVADHSWAVEEAGVWIRGDTILETGDRCPDSNATYPTLVLLYKMAPAGPQWR